VTLLVQQYRLDEIPSITSDEDHLRALVAQDGFCLAALASQVGVFGQTELEG
jgi:hypothetical protein